MQHNKLEISFDYANIKPAEWDKLASTSPFGSFFQTRKSFLFFEQINGIEPFVVSMRKGETVLAVITGIILKEGKCLKSFLTRRAIVIGGPLLSYDTGNEELELLLKELIKFLKNKVIFIEIRNLHDFTNYKPAFEKAGFAFMDHLNFKVDCTNRSLMEQRISKSKKRQIKKGLRQGAEIIKASTVDEVIAFYKILKKLYKEKVKTPLLPKEFFIRFFEKDLGKYLLVRYKNRIVGGIMCPVYRDKVIYEWYVCGKDEEYKNIYPSVLATWAAMDYANKNGLQVFDFMGAGSPGKDYGVREFKSKFGGELVSYGRFLYIVNPFLYYFGKIGVKVLKRF